MNGQIELTDLDYHEAARYLGYGQNEIDADTLKLMRQCENEIVSQVRPRGIYRVFDVVVRQEGVEIAGTNLILFGESIKRHLANCDRAVLMAVTLSDAADRMIRTFQVTDMAKAVIMDSMASAAVEQACNRLETEISRELPQYYQTFRFGLGYGDLPISLQRDFIKILNADKLIGLHVNESSMLVPTKSVTAVIGLSREPVKGQARGCQTCNMRDICKFREKGGHCNG
ncbi:MAG: vitamin B12 dependent-methionine synthase activation domain-containing protein [Eubacteriales bacterium]|nr:vitamin B12 dependent-methionine synthase activation domain-containing protein [Eubacteriales bacterium]